MNDALLPGKSPVSCPNCGMPCFGSQHNSCERSVVLADAYFVHNGCGGGWFWLLKALQGNRIIKDFGMILGLSGPGDTFFLDVLASRLPVVTQCVTGLQMLALPIAKADGVVRVAICERDAEWLPHSLNVAVEDSQPSRPAA